MGFITRVRHRASLRSVMDLTASSSSEWFRRQSVCTSHPHSLYRKNVSLCVHTLKRGTTLPCTVCCLSFIPSGETQCPISRGLCGPPLSCPALPAPPGAQQQLLAVLRDLGFAVSPGSTGVYPASLLLWL